MPDIKNPNRLDGSPVLGQPAMGLGPVAVVERSPTGLALLPQAALKVAAVVVAIASVGVVVFTALMPAAGAAVAPLPWVVTGLGICSAIVALGTTLGIVSQGVRVAPGTQPVTLAAPEAPPSSPTPRIGPHI